MEFGVNIRDTVLVFVWAIIAFLAAVTDPFVGTMGRCSVSFVAGMAAGVSLLAMFLAIQASQHQDDDDNDEGQ